MEHFFNGFIGDPTGQSNASEKLGEFIIIPLILQSKLLDYSSSKGKNSGITVVVVDVGYQDLEQHNKVVQQQHGRVVQVP